METKAHPSLTGCLANALPDEPMFILLARDPDAGPTIQFWAERRARRQVENPTIELAGDAEKIVSAVEDIDTFRAWRAANEGRWRGHPPTLLIDMIPDLADVIYQALLRSEGKAPDVIANHILGSLRERTTP